MKSNNYEQLESQSIFKTEDVINFLKNKVGLKNVPVKLAETLATIGKDVNAINKASLNMFQYLLSLGTKIIYLEVNVKTKNSNNWGLTKKQYGFSPPNLSDYYYKLSRKVVMWETQINDYFKPFGVKPFENVVTNNHNKKLLDQHYKKFNGKLSTEPNEVIKQIENYYKANFPKEYTRITGITIKEIKPIVKPKIISFGVHKIAFSKISKQDQKTINDILSKYNKKVA